MERQTIDFGVDLGTTNSAIGRATGTGVKIIKNRLQSDTTPSAVARTSRGQTLVGQDALDKIDLAPAIQFKRLMGTANKLRMSDGAEMTPEQLSAEVLKDLKAAVQLRYDEQPEHVIVTVPAMFQQPQCEATHRAAALAGLKVATLLQEPIAAATAFLSEGSEQGDYLVYDLGGGTFDASIIRLREGEMNVLAHGGDNYLGGVDFDREVYEWVLNQLKQKLGTAPDLQRSPQRDILMKACEDARKRLSSQTEASIDLGDLQLPVAHLSLDRERLELLIERHVTRTITLARERLEQAGLTPKDVRCLLLVGGPTMTPYVRRRLKEDLGIRLSLEQDPMTVVAQGAAIHASTLLKPDRAASISAPGRCSVSLELFYEPVSPDVRTTVSGRVVNPAVFAGEARLSRAGGDWETGWIPLRQGAFVCEVLLSAGAASQFHLSVRDLRGNLWAVTPSSVALRHGIAAAKPVTPYKYGVVVEDGSASFIVEHNQPLPAARTVPFRAAKAVPAGSSEELMVYFVEGMSPVADDNMRVGELRIRGQDLRRTLREDEKIEVRIHVDESRLVKARVSIPTHDVDYDVAFHSMLVAPPVQDLQDSLEEVRDTLGQTKGLAVGEDEAAILECLRELEQVEAEFERVKEGETGAAERVAQKVAAVRAGMRPLSGKYALQAKHRETMEAIERAERIARGSEDSIGVATARDLRGEANKCLRLEDEKGLTVVTGRAESIFWPHYRKTEECWIGLVQHVRDERRFASDPIQYDEYAKRAADCLQRKDYEGVRINCVQAMEYLPQSESRVNRFWDAGLRA